MLLPRSSCWHAGVFVPDDTATVDAAIRDVQRNVWATKRRTQQVDLAVAIEVSGADRPRFRHLVIDHVLRPFLIPAFFAGVAIPRNQVTGVPGGGDVETPIAVEIGQRNIVSPWTLRRDDMPLPGSGAWACIVSKPDQVCLGRGAAGNVRLIVGEDHVRFTVAVNVASGMPFKPARLILGNDALPE